MSNNHIDSAVLAALEQGGVTYSATLTQRGAVKDGWEHDLWSAVFMRGPDRYSIAYRTGTGHRTPERPEALRQPVPPGPAGVLHCIISDDPRGEEFEEWATDFGYDPDSRRALDVYLHCQRQTREARQFFGPEMLDNLAAMLADY